LSNNNITGEIPSQLQNIAALYECNVWFGNNLTCDPNYPVIVTHCMGTSSEYDYRGDAPNCGPGVTSSSSTVIPSSTHLVSYTVDWFTKFPNARTIRVQYQPKNGKGTGWTSYGVDGTKIEATLTGLLPNTVYQYRLVVIPFTGSSFTTSTLDFTTLSS